MEKATAVDYKARDAFRRAFYEIHPHTISQCVDAGIYTTYKVAAKRTNRLTKRKYLWKPRCVGTVLLLENGRPANVYCKWRPRALLHEVLLTSLLIRLPFPLMEWKRGMMTDSKYKPDAENQRLMIEFDNSTEKVKQVQVQAKRYVDCKKQVLWVVQDVNRFNWITEVASKSNTLLMLADGKEVFDLGGNRVEINQLVNL